MIQSKQHRNGCTVDWKLCIPSPAHASLVLSVVRMWQSLLNLTWPLWQLLIPLDCSYPMCCQPSVAQVVAAADAILESCNMADLSLHAARKTQPLGKKAEQKALDEQKAAVIEAIEAKLVARLSLVESLLDFKDGMFTLQAAFFEWSLTENSWQHASGRSVKMATSWPDQGNCTPSHDQVCKLSVLTSEFLSFFLLVRPEVFSMHDPASPAGTPSSSCMPSLKLLASCAK